MAGAVNAYEQLRNRYLDVGEDDYFFLTRHTNSTTAQRQRVSYSGNSIDR